MMRCCGLTLLGIVLVLARGADAAPPLNVVIILTDNQAPWTLG